VVHEQRAIDGQALALVSPRLLVLSALQSNSGLRRVTRCERSVAQNIRP
jgi:hypothetical protein